MSTIGKRIRAERERLGHSQDAWGELVGVKKNAQINYEGDKRHPDSLYLAAASTVGADVLYILTGERRSSVPMPQADELPQRLRERLTAAISAIEAGLEAVNRQATPSVKAQLIMAAYDILAKDGETATAQIIRLVRA